MREMKGIPDEIYKTGISLEPMGSFGFAWKYKDIFEVLEYLKNNNYGILGGAVCEFDGETIFFNYDNWYLEQENMTWKEYVDASYEVTKNYIERYYEKNGDNYCYDIAASTEIEYYLL